MSTQRPKTCWPAVHGGLFVAILILVAALVPTPSWPWYLAVPLAAYAGLAFLIPPLRRSLPPLRVGQVNLIQIALGILLAGLAAIVLLAYEALVHPDVSALAAMIPVAAFGSLLLAGACFSVFNAALEELIFRWVLYEAVVAEWGDAVAVGATAILFALGHMHGYPPGPVGAFLAGLYGLALGLLRWWTGGLGLPIACHICADATIFGILAARDAFAGTAG